MNTAVRTSARTPVTVICVANDYEVLDACLRKSIEAGRAAAPETQLIVLENAGQCFDSAGAALNHGVRQARNRVCVFVHQDVYLHSLVRLEEAAALLESTPDLGLVGAIGIDAGSALRGQVRDRFIISGSPTPEPIDVDSLDEVLFMATRQQLKQEPIIEAGKLAWHAYAVEYGARMRRLGKRVVAANVPLTHNSLTINLARLSEAHAYVAQLYPEVETLVTTCGVIGRRPGIRLPAAVDRQRWRLRWLKASRRAHLIRRACGPRSVVLADIRFDLDTAMEQLSIAELDVVNVLHADDVDPSLGPAIELPRRGRAFTFRTCSPEQLIAVDGRPAGVDERSRLITNLDLQLLARIGKRLDGEAAIAGYDAAIGYWLLTGPLAGNLPEVWRKPAARPLGM